MKSYREDLWFDVPTRRAFINITPQVEECLQESGIQQGLALINAKYITFPSEYNRRDNILWRHLRQVQDRAIIQ